MHLGVQKSVDAGSRCRRWELKSAVVVFCADSNEVDAPALVWDAVLLRVEHLRVNVVGSQPPQSRHDCLVVLSAPKPQKPGNILQHKSPRRLFF